jgi:hypothetical protein
MKILFNPRRRQSAQTLWIIILVVVLFVVVIGYVAYLFWQAVQKLCPPPDTNQGTWIGLSYPVGSTYDGGFVQGYYPVFDSSSVRADLAAPPPGFIVNNVYIYAADVPNPPAWTNLIMTIPYSQLNTVLGGNGLPVENWPVGQMPSQRFYNFVVDGVNSQ